MIIIRKKINPQVKKTDLTDTTAIVKPLGLPLDEIWTYKGDFERRSLKDDDDATTF